MLITLKSAHKAHSMSYHRGMINTFSIMHVHELKLIKCTVATSHGDPLFSKWGPDGDPNFSEMGTKWGPSPAEWGPKKRMFAKLIETS